MTTAQCTPLAKDDQEEWRPAPGWEGWYDVSNLGRVRRVRGVTAGRIVSMRPLPNGYLTVALSRPGKAQTRAVHRLVALAFLGPCPPGMEIDHKDNDRANPAASNLQYLTHLDNMRQAVARGTIARRAGVRTNTKLTLEQVREIRASTVHHGTLQWQYGVTAEQIVRIRRGKAWRDEEDAIDAGVEVT